MRIIVLIAFLTISKSLLGQSNLELGSGVITVNLEALPTLNFYSDTSNKIPVKTIYVIKNEHEDFAIKNLKQNSWLAPEGIWLDYNIFTFRTTRKFGNWCEVYVNNSKKTKYWLKLNKNLVYLDWKKYLFTQTTWIGKRDEYALEVKQLPSETSKRIKMMEKEDCFVVLEVKGDWIKIKTSDGLECSESKYPVKAGWIRWMRDNRLLVDYGLSC